jgi:hypothetical protein
MGAAGLLLAALWWVAACGAGPLPAGGQQAAPGRDVEPSAGEHGGGPAAYAPELARCVDRTNDYRRTVSKPPLRPSSALAAYAARAARHDGLAHRPHVYFERTDGGGLALAENLVPWWSLARRHTVMAIVDDGLALMWAEGPKGAHYRNMTGPYHELGCGLFVNGDEVTLVQAFR